ncbi:hypothetical protein HPB47_010029 [Ixodes persulcatus]|uniref:Uncharacterized protein n=1 Tax=Ixodes persulcatus TaxID=34615 RepID=A0AC60P067_IXOPE|nr:hypothetical protein HPB47_010029 [Ixodes persulcatus]
MNRPRAPTRDFFEPILPVFGQGGVSSPAPGLSAGASSRAGPGPGLRSGASSRARPGAGPIRGESRRAGPGSGKTACQRARVGPGLKNIDFDQATDQSATGSSKDHATITVSSTASLRNFTIVCHGLPRRLAAPADTLVRALLQHQDRNVLEILWNVVDCQLNGSDFYYCPENARPSDVRWYQEAASDARLVARVVARMLNRLVNNYDYDLTRVHFIGFGLGAHVGGFVAHELGYTGNVLGRLTALDAASPLFESRGLSRLSPSSALRVEAVHTGGARPCGLSMAGPLGTLDIYVNGGERQPHCKSDRMCSHLAALGYYAQSVEKCLVDAVSTPLPGYWTDITGIVNVRRSSLRCLRLSSSDSVTVGTSKSASIVAQWTLVVTLHTLLVTCWELAHITALF